MARIYRNKAWSIDFYGNSIKGHTFQYIVDIKYDIQFVQSKLKCYLFHSQNESSVMFERPMFYNEKFASTSDKIKWSDTSSCC